MTAFHGLQVALAACAIAITAMRIRVVLFVTHLDAPAFTGALARLLEAARPDRARALARGAMPAWVARVSLVELDERTGELPPGSVAELVMDLRREALIGIRALRTIGRSASPLAFVGVMFELGMAFQPEQGLLALQRGLVEQRALQRAVLGVTIGLVTSLCCFVAASTLHGAARDRMRAIDRTNELFDRSC